MLTIDNIKQIQNITFRVKPEDVLTKLHYNMSYIFYSKGHYLTDQGWYYHNYDGCFNYPALNQDENIHPDEFLKLKNRNYDCMLTFETQNSPIVKGYKPKSGHRTFLYTNSQEALNLEGKKYYKFRKAKKYFEDENFTIETYSNVQGVQSLFSNELVLEILTLLKDWSVHQKSIGHTISYDITRAIRDLFVFQSHIDFYMTIFRYKGEIVHYQVSERINTFYVTVSEIKPSKSIDREIETKFKYTSRLAHWEHIKFWDNTLSIEDRKSPIYYDLGFSDWNSFKNELNPYMVPAGKVTDIVSEDTNTLF